MAEKSKPIIHPALAVMNIRNQVPIKLELERGLYSTWAHLFTTHCKAYRVLDHILPPISTPHSADFDQEEWECVDAHVLQWIDGTISRDLMHTIIDNSGTATARKAWEAIRDIFQDNRNTRALYLEDQFTQVEMEKFSDISSYCLHLKTLADQLANVGAPISDQRLVLQLIKVLPPSYNEVATHLEQQDPLPSFYQARSRLILHETRRNHQSSRESQTETSALLVSQASDDDSLTPPRSTSSRGS